MSKLSDEYLVKTRAWASNPTLIYYTHFQNLLGHIDAQADENKRLRDALLVLSCLGNGNQPGNSDGNIIAQEALQESK